ncbi:MULTISPECIES: DUF7848 domain-containing protein [unclassified Streptomyces]|uniref:DUF7848 domain-containing protein n=1 Tax=unclassified Streptomyces TaxID=2593676 RepID=UPI002E378769|nr:hypothetical protein [Streptomyces sp. NBC_01477]
MIRHVNWLITRDRAAGAPQEPLYEFECTTCSTLDAPDGGGSRSPASEDVADGQAWAIKHSAKHPGHTHFRESITRFWRTQMQN